MAKQKQETSTVSDRMCGIVMPMSAICDLPESHWREVKKIIQQAVAHVGFSSRIVSEADDANIFVASIVQNLYFDPIVVCDVSCKNPNVMFELGLRLAFNKPTVLIVDDKTGFSSDVQGIKHLIYPRDLRYQKMVAFKRKLGELVKATHDESKKPESKKFLDYYQKLNPAKIESKEVSPDVFLDKKFDEFFSKVESRLAGSAKQMKEPDLYIRRRDGQTLREIQIESYVRSYITNRIKGEPLSFLQDKRLMNEALQAANNEYKLDEAEKNHALLIADNVIHDMVRIRQSKGG
jgi:hypothetical protein